MAQYFRDQLSGCNVLDAEEIDKWRVGKTTFYNL